MACPLLEEIVATGLVRLADGRTLPLSGGISPESGQLIQDLLRKTGAKTTLEVGLWYGISTLFICDTLAGVPGARHHAIDPNQLTDAAGIGLANIKRAGFDDLVEAHLASSHRVLPELERAGLTIDFALIDASHRFDDTLIEFFYIDRLLRTGGVVAFDDASMPAVRKVLRFVAKNRAYRVCAALGALSGQAARLKYALIRTMARPLSRLIKPEYLEPDLDFGLTPGARMVALEKQANDSDETRPWHYFRDF